MWTVCNLFVLIKQFQEEFPCRNDCSPYVCGPQQQTESHQAVWRTDSPVSRQTAVKLAPSQLVGPSLTFHNTPHYLSFSGRIAFFSFLHISHFFLQSPTVQSLCGQSSPAGNTIHPSEYSSLSHFTVLYCYPTTSHLQGVQYCRSRRSPRRYYHYFMGRHFDLK